MSFCLLLKTQDGLYLTPRPEDAGHAAGYHSGKHFDSAEGLDAFVIANDIDIQSRTTASLPEWGVEPGGATYVVGYGASLDLDPKDIKSGEAWLADYRGLKVLLDPRLRALIETLHAAPTRLTVEASHEAMSDIRQLALRTPTLPPAEHTNTWIVGHERMIVVDPAPYDDNERKVLVQELKRLAAAGQQLSAIVLTHHHNDHMGAAMWLSAQMSIPIWAHPVTATLLKGVVRVDHHLNENDVINLGTGASGHEFALKVLHTPGHAPGHIVLVDTRPGARAMIVGDMVAAVGTILVDPEDGDMKQYIEQLERMASRGESVLMPAHGPPIAFGENKLRGYVEHRLKREAKVERALAAYGEATPDALVAQAYDDTPVFLHPLALRACWSHLLKLVADGRAERIGERLFRTSYERNGIPG